MKIFNLNADEWDRTEEREGWRFKDGWVGAHTDAELIGASMYEVEPGNKQGPFHTHHANEEWAIVLRGEPTLRTHEGEQQLRQGDVVAFPRGKEGAHQIRNDTDAPVRVLMLSTLIAPDIVEYLDTGKISARSVAGERIIFARPGPGLEDSLALCFRDTRTVVLDRVDDAGILALQRQPHTRRSVAVGVFDHGLQDPLGEIGVDADPQ